MKANTQIKYEISSENFCKISGSPIAYWASDVLFDAFEVAPLLSDIADPRQGFATGDNEKFLRFWHEVDDTKTEKSCSRSVATKSKKKWFPCNKGGGYRKWYGNNERYVNWENDGFEMKNFKGSVIRNPSYYFNEGGTWSTLSNAFSMRYSPEGFLFESKGSVCFAKNPNQLFYIIGFLNSCIVKEVLLILSPTLDYHEGPLGRVPVIVAEIDRSEIEQLVESSIGISKIDWDAFETSWDFKKHPLI